MGKWYVLAGRFTFLEKQVHNGLEVYTWNESQQRIDVTFDYRQGSFNGPKKSLPQKAWVANPRTNAHWKVSPLWPLRFDYLVIALDPDYQWTAIGVPNQKYLWIMARDWKNPQEIIPQVIEQLKKVGYSSQDLELVPHQWSEEKND